MNNPPEKSNRKLELELKIAYIEIEKSKKNNVYLSDMLKFKNEELKEQYGRNCDLVREKVNLVNEKNVIWHKFLTIAKILEDFNLIKMWEMSQKLRNTIIKSTEENK